MMLAEVLYDGFASVHRRASLILLDVLWKTAWVAVSTIIVVLYLAILAAEIQSIQLEANDGAVANPLAALMILREFWAAYSSQILSAVVLIAVVSSTAWCLMESYFRSRLLSLGTEKRNTGLFLASGVARTLILGSATAIACAFSFGPFATRPIGEWSSIWSETQGAILICAIALVAFAYLLTVADTLVRSNAVSLFGSHMFEITSIIGVLFFAEACIAASAIVAVGMAISQASSASELFVAAALAILAGFLLSAVHSYLLLVRFFSIDIMKRDVIDV